MTTEVHDRLLDLILKAQNRIEKEVDHILSDCDTGLAFTHWNVLKQLSPQQGKAMGELHRATTIDNSTLTKTVDHLVTRGFAFRIADPQDRRKILVCSSEAGKALYARLRRKINKRQKEIFPSLDNDATSQVTRYLQSIAA